MVTVRPIGNPIQIDAKLSPIHLYGIQKLRIYENLMKPMQRKIEPNKSW